MATESVFITATTDEFENRDVATVYLPGAFSHTDINPNNNILHMVLQGELTKLMLKVNPSMYRKYVISDKKGQKSLYVELQKDIYTTFKASLLF